MKVTSKTMAVPRNVSRPSQASAVPDVRRITMKGTTAMASTPNCFFQRHVGLRELGWPVRMRRSTLHHLNPALADASPTGDAITRNFHSPTDR